MKARKLHSWDVTIREAREIQEGLRERVVARWRPKAVRLVAGADVSFPARDQALAAVVVMTCPDLDLVETRVCRSPCRMPYVPGFLSFREMPALIRCLESLRHEPDLVLFDGQGIAHPRRFGLAAHAGLLFDVPSIGCAKSRLFGEHRALGLARGDSAPLLAPEGEVVGAVLRTRTDVRPVYVSVGHRVDLENAVRFVLALAPRYRIPEPLRLADRLTKDPASRSLARGR